MSNVNLTLEQKLMIGFLVKVAIPLKYYDNKKSNRIKDAIWRAHRDVLTGRRLGGSVFEDYVERTKGGFDNDNSPLKKLYDCITDCKSRNCSLTSKCLFEILAADFSQSDYGALQKLVNMTLKYFILLKEFENADVPEVNYQACHCPLDSNIIKSVSKTYQNYKGIRWTLDLDQKNPNNKNECYYESIQNDISTLLKDETDTAPFGNLTYDFLHWKSEK